MTNSAMRRLLYGFGLKAAGLIIAFYGPVSRSGPPAGREIRDALGPVGWCISAAGALLNLSVLIRR